MKKLFSILTAFIAIALVSCCQSENMDENCDDVTIIRRNSDNVEYVLIKDWFDFKYEKIVIEGHDYYFRGWATRGGHGSDLVHNPNCRQCKK